MKRIVVKVGSQVLCNEHGALNDPVLASLSGQVAALAAQGWQPLLVSSGAVASGAGVARSEPGAERLQRIADPVGRKQAFAALGQVRLMETWRRYLSEFSLSVAQILATRSDFQSRRHYLNMRNCVDSLLNAGVIPIVNENDVVSVTELMFTDNDELAGLLAGMVKAELLCLLSTVPGVYDGDPGLPETRCIPVWDEQRHRVEDIVRRGASTLGRGGMHSKIAVARKTAKLGTRVVIADGRSDGILQDIAAGRGVGTLFPAAQAATSAKRWLAGAQGSYAGSVMINAGAAAALLDRNRLSSLLPIGITQVEGEFGPGDVIAIRDADGRVIGCGRARYDCRQAEELKGRHGQKALIHYDYLYLVP